MSNPSRLQGSLQKIKTRFMRWGIIKKLSPVWKLLDKLQRFEWLSSVVWFGLGWGSLEKGKFPLARLFFTLAAFFLGLQIVSGSLRNLKAKKWKVTGSLVGLFTGIGFWIFLMYWSAAEESETELYSTIGFKEWLASHFVMPLIPWLTLYWIALIGSVTVALLGTHAKLWQQRCPDSRLHALAKHDKETIKSLVRIPGIGYYPCFDSEGPYIDFAVSVFNGSLFDVAVSNKMGGYLFNNTDSKKFYYPARIESDEPIQIRSRRDNYFVIRQPLRFEEIPAFEGKGKVLSLGGLVITFEGDGIVETRLDTNHSIETQKGGWRAWDQIGFICSYSDNRWAALQSGTFAHSIELEELRAKLKDKDTAALAPPEITAFKPYLEMVSKETSGGRYIKLGTDLIGHHSDIKSAAFLPVFLNPTDGTVGSVDISGDITLKGEHYERRVEAVCWHGRDAATVPLRHNETRSLFIVLCDGKRLTTYEHQYKSRPLEKSISASIVYAKIHVHIKYEKDRRLNLFWWVKIQKTDKDLTVNFVDEAVFDQAVV